MAKEKERQKGRNTQPPFNPSVGSLCHFCVTPTHLSYRFSIFETSATALCGTTGTQMLNPSLLSENPNWKLNIPHKSSINPDKSPIDMGLQLVSLVSPFEEGVNPAQGSSAIVRWTPASVARLKFGLINTSGLRSCNKSDRNRWVSRKLVSPFMASHWATTILLQPASATKIAGQHHLLGYYSAKVILRISL